LKGRNKTIVVKLKGTIVVHGVFKIESLKFKLDHNLCKKCDLLPLSELSSHVKIPVAIGY